MSFAINPSLNHIDIREPYILEMYRSAKEVLLPGARFRGHPCEAYICITRIEKTVKAYVALLEMEMNSVFVYTSDFSTDNSTEYPKVFAEADEFAGSLGFSMERVNLDFSPAMREVIIKGFRVMKAPQKKQLLRSMSDYPQAGRHSGPTLPLPAEKSGVIPLQKENLPTELKKLHSVLSGARAEIERLTGENLSLKQNAGREIAALKSAAEKAAELKRISDERFAQEIELAKEETIKAAGRKDDALGAALSAELDSTRHKAELAGKEFNARITALKGRIETLESRNNSLEGQLSTEKSSADEKISQLTAEKESLSALLHSEQIAAADKIAALALFETSWREGQQRQEDLCRDLELMKKQTDLLEAELAAARGRETDEAALILRIAALEKEAEASRVEIEQLGNASLDRAAVQAELKSLAEAKNDVEAEYIRLANEAMQKETEMLAVLYTADAEIMRLSRELESRTQAAEMEKTALQEELQLLLSGSIQVPADAAGSPAEVTTFAAAPPLIEKVAPIQGTPAEPLTVAAPVEAATVAPATAVPAEELQLPADSTADDITDAPVSGDPDITKGLMNEFGSFCGSSGHSMTEFAIDPTICSVEYSEPAEILAIVRSTNTVQAVPDGSKMQRCEGYVIATKKDGDYRAYVAWYLTESRKVIICTPEQQPADSGQCTQILQDAITYFEIVGFMMELEDLGGTMRSYTKAIRKVPALSRKQQNGQIIS